MLHEGMHIFQRSVDGRRYRIAAQSVWDSSRGRSIARQVVLGPADAPGKADLGATHTIGTRAVGDVGALLWVAEQLNLVEHIDRACPGPGDAGGPTVGELVLAVALQRVCAPGPKRDLAEFIEECVPRVSCLPASKFHGQAFHRAARSITDEQLEQAQIAIARAAVKRFTLSTNVLAFDTTNFDTHIATTTAGELARRGHAKSKRADLRVVGLGVLASETGHVPLLHRAYPGNGSDQGLLESCLEGLGELHDTLDEAEGRKATRTLVRDGGFWSPQLELDLGMVGYYTLISLPLSHKAAEHALEHAAKRGAMQKLSGEYQQVRAARIRANVSGLDRTLVVVESQELLAGQKRGIAQALVKAKAELRLLERLTLAGKISRDRLAQRAKTALGREHLSSFVEVTIDGPEQAPVMRWRVDPKKRRALETTRLGRRVLCTDQHNWSTTRIVHAFRGQWNVEELFRRAKKGGVAQWGPSFQRSDGSLRLHTFATVLGLTLVALVRLALGTRKSARAMLDSLRAMRATLVRTATGERGRRPTVLLPPELSSEQLRAVRVFELQRWLPAFSSCRVKRAA